MQLFTWAMAANTLLNGRMLVSPVLEHGFGPHKPYDRSFNSRSYNLCSSVYICAPISTGNTFQGLPRLRETADNNESYIPV
jgi:hypothetical protein